MHKTLLLTLTLTAGIISAELPQDFRNNLPTASQKAPQNSVTPDEIPSKTAIYLKEAGAVGLGTAGAGALVLAIGLFIVAPHGKSKDTSWIAIALFGLATAVSGLTTTYCAKQVHNNTQNDLAKRNEILTKINTAQEKNK